ncbi:MAG TPA: YdcF family protein [Cyclobacteriaceae bacterium]|jgi:uncharacterized SAM-binding protein YcdF (DUF218 family)|nr:YdcF family protein [Cyclobacteriaceae bacterium]
MFFVLSKILAYLIMPFVIICGLLIASAIVKKQPLKKILFYAGLSLLLFCSNDFIVNEVMMLWEVPITPFSKMNKTYEWAILLTGVTRYDEGLINDRVYFNRGADRVTHTVQLYKLGKVKKILVSGGSGSLTIRDRKEADEIEAALLLMGIPQEDIVKEANSKNTHESSVEVKKILTGKTTSDSCILVTSGYHMRRSAACFAKVGWKMDCFSVDFLSHQRKYTPDVLFIPRVEAIGTWQVLIKEWVGMISYKLAGYA